MCISIHKSNYKLLLKGFILKKYYKFKFNYIIYNMCNKRKLKNYHQRFKKHLLKISQ